MTEELVTEEVAPKAVPQQSAPRQRPTVDRSPLHGLMALTRRDLRKWYGNPIQLVISLVQPIVWLGLFGKALNFGAFVSSAGGSSSGR